MSPFSKLILALALLLCTLMPSRQSLWIDEAQTWRFASRPTVGALFSGLRETRTSEGLMPLGMLSAWAGIRLLGTGEWQLRAPNILWAMVAVCAFYVLGRRWRAPWAPLLFAVQPFLWYYADEARPYVLQMAASAWLLVGVVACVEDRRVNVANGLILLLSGAILLGTVLFGVLLVGPAFLLVALLAWRERWPLPRQWKIGVAAFLAWGAVFGGYYLAALRHGATGAKLWEVGVQNVAFAAYEFLGFSGLGPSRHELRELASAGGVGAVLRSLPLSAVLPLAALGLAYVGTTAGMAGHGGDKNRRTLVTVEGLGLGSAGVLILLSFAAHFPFWGRHLAPMFPFVIGLLVLLLRDLRVLRKAFAAVAGTALFLLLAASACLLRTAPRHAKDDYRAAVAAARSEIKAGGTVWWCADGETARYYGLPMPADPAASDPLVFVSGLPREALAARRRPQLIVVSKPEMFDPAGTVAEYARQAEGVTERLNAFVLTTLRP